MRRILAVATASMTLLVACAGIDVQTGVYQTLDEARAAGAIERGWVPRGLPPSASDLREGHLDDGRRWGVFSFDASHGDVLKTLLADEITTGAVECRAPGRLEWWPRLLRSPIDLQSARSAGLRLYRSRDGQLTYAVNWAQGRAFYWRG